ncbi:MAG: filamin/ABP280 repeat domain-containing protein [Longimicrobiales bacterium]
MRRAPGPVFWLFGLLLAGCGETHETALVQAPLEGGEHQPSPSSDIFDGASGAVGANPHFFFLSPIAETSPEYSGIQDDRLEPVVTVCPFEAWNSATEECALGQETAVFTMDASDPKEQVVLDPGSKFNVVWKTSSHPAQAGETYRVSVAVTGQVLGYADVTAFNQDVYSGYHNTESGVIAISDNGDLNITFRIEEGALEAEYCDPDSVEDCDVALFTYGEGGCLRVFENPDGGGEQLGSQACVPANAATLDGEPVEGTYAVILTLEKQDQSQGGDVPPGQQIPYFPDLFTDPPGITFDPNSTGIQVAFCQVDDEGDPGFVPEELHPFLRPFIVYADGTTVLPEDYSYGVPECEGFTSHDHLASAAAHGPETGGFLRGLARGVARVGQFLLPQPLVARRLHGGLNTTVYDTRGDDSDSGEGGENVSVFATDPEPEIAEFGAILDVDPLNSEATVPATGQVGVETTITILALDPQGLPFPFELPVTVHVVSGPDAIEGTVVYDGGGEYTATYTPTTVGTDVITITIDGTEIAGSPFTSEVVPLSGDLVVDLDITGSAPEDGLPVYLYKDDAPAPFLTGTTDTDGQATFVDLDFGEYTVHLPQRDFDVDFQETSRAITHDQAPRTVVFSATTLPMPEGSRIWRIREGGNGNAYNYIVDGRSFGASLNQIAGMAPLHGVQPHMVDIFSPAENDFVKEFFVLDPSLCPDETNPKKCKYQGWIGLTDEAVETEFRWVTGDLATWFNWPDGNTAADQPKDPKGNLDHVEIDLTGTWGIINGASSTNEGYFVEWEAQQPATPPSG